MAKFEQWEGFQGKNWVNSVDVRDFIQCNYTPYDGDETFLEGPTEATDKLWGKLQELQKEERAKGGVLDMETEVVSSLTAYGPGYICEELKDKEALTVINEVIIPALNIVGKDYETGKIFLPQLIQSAETTKKAFEVVKETFSASDGKEKGPIIIATVEGDIHDIGKNIVKVVLESYGYKIIDLGKDVPAETVVDAAKQEDVRLVGLSALMTTTVSSMEKTIQALRKETPDCKVVVGGAVLTEEYAGSIGADAYGKDAMATVHYAQKVYGEQEAESEKTPE